MKSLKEKLVQEGLIKRQAGMDVRAKIEEWLNEYKIKNYTINDDLTIDIKGDIYLNHYKEKQLPDYIQFGEVTGSFRIHICPKLVSLKGCPERVGERFNCSYCSKLESLEGAPRHVGDGFECIGCENLKTLEGAPKEVGGYFSCGECKNLKSLEGAPKEVGERFNCSDCENLKTLEGCPKEVGGNFYCSSCGGQFTEGDVKKICKVKGRINV